MSNSMNQNEILSALKWRYATKSFDPQKKIGKSDWDLLKESLLLSPSSYGLQPWKFLIVQNPDLRQQLREVSWNQTQVTDCSHLVVMTCRETVDEAYIGEFLDRTAEVRNLNVDQLQGYRQVIVGDLVKGPRSKVIETWAQRQAYIAMGFLMETAALLRVDACPLEGLDAQAYDRILKREGSGYKTIAAVALGYRSAEDKYQGAAKVRFPEEKIIEVIS